MDREQLRLKAKQHQGRIEEQSQSIAQNQEKINQLLNQIKTDNESFEHEKKLN